MVDKMYHFFLKWRTGDFRGKLEGIKKQLLLSEIVVFLLIVTSSERLSILCYFLVRNLRDFRQMSELRQLDSRKGLQTLLLRQGLRHQNP